MGVMHIPGHTHQAPREVALEEIEAVLGDCHLCQLYQSRHNIVFGVGNPHAPVMFISEAPGRNEDLQGEPIEGAAGEDLNGILSLAGLKREDVYIANVLKCRPPGNRNPRPEEVLACSPFLREQIRSIWPDIIVTLGNPATHFVLKTESGITKLRGRVHQMGHFVVMPTFRPAAALRNPAWQELLEEDFKMLGDYLERHPAPEGASELYGAYMSLERLGVGTYKTTCAADTEYFGELIAPCLEDGDVLILTDGLGVGKTH